MLVRGEHFHQLHNASVVGQQIRAGADELIRHPVFVCAIASQAHACQLHCAASLKKGDDIICDQLVMWSE